MLSRMSLPLVNHLKVQLKIQPLLCSLASAVSLLPFIHFICTPTWTTCIYQAEATGVSVRPMAKRQQCRAKQCTKMPSTSRLSHQVIFNCAKATGALCLKLQKREEETCQSNGHNDCGLG